MKKNILYLILTLILSSNTLASQHSLYKFKFNNGAKKTFVITQKAVNKEEAFKLAARECYKKLTKNQYPGEEQGLLIIDICANPKI
jgi:hypothetical protein